MTIDRRLVLRVLLPLGALAGPCLSAASFVGWQLGRHPYLGRPWLGVVYPPSWVLEWWRLGWGGGAHQAAFASGLWWSLLTAAPAVLAMLVVGPPGGVRRPFERVPGAGLSAGRDLVALGHVKRRPPGIVLGLDGRDVLCDAGDGHVMVLGPTRSGKGVGVVVPTLLTWPHSAVVLDPKTELERVTGPLRQRLGPVYTIDATSSRSCRLNPLLALRLGPNLVGDADAAAIALVRGDGGATGDGKYFEETAAFFLAALLVVVRESADPTLAHLWRLVKDMTAGRPVATGHPHAAWALAWRDKLSDRARSNIDNHILTSLKFLAAPLVRAVTAGSDFDPADLRDGPRPVTVYLATPLDPSRALALKPFMRLMITTLLGVKDGDASDFARPDRRPLLAMLDEAVTPGHIAPMETGMATWAGAGIRVCWCVQDDRQTRREYGPLHAIASNCGTRVYSASLSSESVEDERRLAGSDTDVRRGVSRLPGIIPRLTKSQTETSAPVIESGELMALAKRHMVVFSPGLRRPAKVRKLRYYEDRRFLPLAAPPNGPRVGLAAAELDLPVDEFVPAAPPLSLTDEQRAAFRLEARDGEGEEAVARSILAAAARRIAAKRRPPAGPAPPVPPAPPPPEA